MIDTIHGHIVLKKVHNRIDEGGMWRHGIEVDHGHRTEERGRCQSLLIVRIMIELLHEIPWMMEDM